MKRRILSLLTSLMLVAGLIGVSAPAVTATNYFRDGSACDTTNEWLADPTRWLLYENSVGDTTDGNDKLYGCLNDPNLHDESAPTGCHGHLFTEEWDWGDCGSAIAANIPQGYILCVYEDTNYYTDGPLNTSGILFYQKGPINFGQTNIGIGDQASSIKIVQGWDRDDCAD